MGILVLTNLKQASECQGMPWHSSIIVLCSANYTQQCSFFTKTHIILMKSVCPSRHHFNNPKCKDKRTLASSLLLVPSMWHCLCMHKREGIFPGITPPSRKLFQLNQSNLEQKWLWDQLFCPPGKFKSNRGIVSTLVIVGILQIQKMQGYGISKYRKCKQIFAKQKM